MMMRIGKALRSLPELFAGFWFTTTAFLLLGPALMVLLVTVDGLAGEAGVFPRLFISPSSAQTILGAIAGSLVTVAALTSSLTVVTLQLLSTQFTPRALRGFLRGRLSQAVLGSLIGIFLYCLLVAVAVRDPGDLNQPFVPSLSVVSILLALVGLVLLVVFIHHLVTSIQVSNLAAVIARQTRCVLVAAQQAQELTEAAPPPTLPSHLVRADRPGYVRSVDLQRAVRAVRRDRVWLHFTVRPGDFVTRSTPILEYRAVAAPGPDLLAVLRHAAPVTTEREIAHDPSFGVRQLTDIALRAIAPGVNDPSTAVTCIGYLQDILVELAARPLSPSVGVRLGSSTVLADRPTFALYASAIIEIGRYARDARVAAALLDALIATAAAARSGQVAEHLDVLVVAADAVAGQAVADARTGIDRDRLHAALVRFEHVSGRPLQQSANPEFADALVRAADTTTGPDHVGQLVDKPGKPTADGGVS